MIGAAVALSKTRVIPRNLLADATVCSQRKRADSDSSPSGDNTTLESTICGEYHRKVLDSLQGWDDF